MILWIIVLDGREALAEIRSRGTLGRALDRAAETAVLGGALRFLGYLLVMLVLMPVIGQKLVLPLFIAVYLARWGKYGWRIFGGYAFCGWLPLVVFYDKIMHPQWYPAWIYCWLPEALPSWLFV